MAEIKYYLRKHDFPFCATKALDQLEQLCSHGSSSQQQRLIQEVMEEFIFCEIDRRGTRKKRLSAIQELQLLEVLCHYFEKQENEVIRNTVFLTLFHYEGGNASNKTKVLGKLVSLSIAVRNVAVLGCSSVWMQQQGCTSDIVVNLVRDLIIDYFCMIPHALTFLQNLPDVSAHFTANFITASTSLYSSTGQKTVLEMPTDLLHQITKWIVTNPHLCLAPLTTNLQNSLPRGSIVMPSVVPLPGLIRWCVEAPLLDKLAKNTETNPLENNAKKYRTFAELHMGILECMMDSRKIKERMIQREMITTRDFIMLTDGILNILQDLGNDVKCDEVNVALDRFGQALQVSIAMNCLHGNIGDLCWYISKLPKHRLLKIIMEKNRP